MVSGKKITSFFKKIGLISACRNDDAVPCKPRRGHVTMYVGEKRKRYEVPVDYLNFPAFKRGVSLPQDDEYDCTIDGPIVLLHCSSKEFDKVLSECAKGSHL